MKKINGLGKKLAAVALGLGIAGGMSIATVAPASAAEARPALVAAGFCSSLLPDGSNIVGSCQGVVNLGWSCWGIPWNYESPRV